MSRVSALREQAREAAKQRYLAPPWQELASESADAASDVWQPEVERLRAALASKVTQTEASAE